MGNANAAQLLIAPLTFLSFLISLALIDQQNTLHRYRTHQHSAPRPPAPTTLFGRVRESLHSLIYRPASPYAYLRSPGQKMTASLGSRKEEPWYWHTKQRHMMAAEMDEAFRVRKWVLGMLALALVGGLGAVGMFLTVASRWMGWYGTKEL